MVDLDYIAQNRTDYEASARARGLDLADLKLDEIFKLVEARRALIAATDALRQERNALTEQIARMPQTQRPALIGKVKTLKDQLKPQQQKLTALEAELKTLSLALPNIVHPDMPRGKDSRDNKVIKEWGIKPKFDFTPKDHVEIGKKLDLIDLEASARVSGSRFYYLKNELVLMQLGLFQLALKKTLAAGFSPMLPPVLVKGEALVGTGYFPFENNQIFEVAKPAEDGQTEKLYLTGTSEQAIVAYHSDTTFNEKQLPVKYVGISPCFRSEVGSWGKDVRGIKRVHQFDKVEMIFFTTAETSQALMREALALEESILQDLGLPYHVLDMCTGDVGLPTYRKYDLEVWLPTTNDYMEVMSNSDLHEFHARRLNIRYKTKTGETKYVHTISATAITNTRPLLAILENYQQADGSVKVPKVLREFVGKDTLNPKTQAPNPK